MRLKDLEKEAKPFAVFRLPKAEHIQLYVQKKNALQTTTDFSEKGFVMSPFSTTENVFISADYIYNLPIENNAFEPQIASVTLPGTQEEKQSFMDAVLQAKDAIAQGGIEKVVLSRPLFVKSKRSAISVFKQLTTLYPNAFVYCCFHPKVGLWLGASPERFVSLNNATLKTMSLAGTLPYTPQKPQWTSKELHEQALVTDSIKKDLMQAFPSIKLKVGKTENIRAGGLYHLGTQIALKSLALDLKKAVNALHPTPAVGGLPKKAAFEFIKKTEKYNREFYTGFLGPFSGNKKADFFVNLRCAKKNNNVFTVYVGAGITRDSDPEKEYEETQRKAQTLGKLLLF